MIPPDDSVGVGVRNPATEGGRRFSAPCATCGATVYFRDVTPMRCATKLCAECFIASIEAGESYTPMISPENAALIRAMAEADKRRPS